MPVNVKEKLGLSEVTDQKGIIWKALLAEFFGNFLLNFFGCASTLYMVGGTDPASCVKVALTFGLIIFITVQALGHVSGAHFNPAVTVAMMLTSKCSVIKAILYVFAQCIGSIAGSAVLKALIPEELQGSLGMTTVNEKLNAYQAFGVEFFLGFVLVHVVFGVCDSNKRNVSIPAPLAIGLTVAAGHLSAISLTGASMNPARTFGSAVICGIWADHWVYWLGPCLGGAVAGILYESAFVAPCTNGEVTEYSPVHVEEKELKQLGRKEKEDIP